jgi:hypothetical protein
MTKLRMNMRTAIFIGIAFGFLAGAPALAYDSSGNCGYYTNSYGHVVPRPCGNATTDAPPPNSTAVCRDGTYSFSEHRSGTCSGHGGVQSWR